MERHHERRRKNKSRIERETKDQREFKNGGRRKRKLR